MEQFLRSNPPSATDAKLPEKPGNTALFVVDQDDSSVSV
jgi:hypothetical protein